MSYADPQAAGQTPSPFAGQPAGQVSLHQPILLLVE